MCRSVSSAISLMVRTDSTGYFPEADSPESITGTHGPADAGAVRGAGGSGGDPEAAMVAYHGMN